MNRRQLLGALGAAGVLAATGGAFYAAGRSRTPQQQAVQAQPPPPSVVTAKVRRGQLVDELRLDGTLARASSVAVTGPSAVDGADKLVVTGVHVKVGDSVNAGDLLVAVSGRPVIALAGSFPAYRELHRGMTGPDVEQLQRALAKLYGTKRSGTFDAGTEDGLRRLYRHIGYPPVMKAVEPDATEPSPSPSAGAAAPILRIVVPVGEIAFVHTLPAVVGSVPARVGATASSTLVTLSSGGWQVVAPVDEDAEKALSDQSPHLELADGPAKGRSASLTTIRPPATSTDGQGGDEAVFGITGTFTGKPGEAQQLIVIRASSPPDALIVPVTALWTAADGTVSVQVFDGDSTHEVTVTVGVSVLGECAVSGDLTEGDLVAVSEK